MEDFHWTKSFFVYFYVITLITFILQIVHRDLSITL